jgi:hypothetical protein
MRFDGSWVIRTLPFSAYRLQFSLATSTLGNADKTDIIVIHILALFFILRRISACSSGNRIDDSGDLGGRGVYIQGGGESKSR